MEKWLVGIVEGLGSAVNEDIHGILDKKVDQKLEEILDQKLHNKFHHFMNNNILTFQPSRPFQNITFEKKKQVLH